VTGTPADWTDTSKVLATVHGRIHCMVLLPDHRTIRFVWGNPRHAEDVEIVSGQRVPSPIVPETYAAGCPDLSPDGRFLVFQGYDEEGRPVIFNATKPDGSQARPISPSASPTSMTEPRWLDNEAVVFSPDDGHVAVLQPSIGKVTILPDDPSVGEVWAGWRVGDGRLVAGAVAPDGSNHMRLFSWPGLKRRRSFAIGGLIVDCALSRSRFWCSDVAERALLAFDIDRFVGTRIAAIRDQEIMYIIPSDKQMAFVSRRLRSEAWVALGTVPTRRVTVGDTIDDAADCGNRGYLVARRAGRAAEIVRIGRDGVQTILTSGHIDDGVDCSKVTEDWCFTRIDAGGGLFHCKGSSCSQIHSGVANWPSLSPDATRVAYLDTGGRGSTVKWVPSSGGEVHDVGVSEGGCAPGWSSNSTMWISRRIQGRPWWTEVEADGGRATGRTAPSANDCQEGYPDPLSPVRPEIRIVMDRISQLRVQKLPD